MIATVILYVLDYLFVFQKVEGTIDAMAISSCGSKLYMSNCQDNNLHVVNTRTLEVTHTWPGIHNEYSEKFHLSANGKLLYFPATTWVV